MSELGAVIDEQGRVIYWHAPAGRSPAALPDSAALWAVLWAERARVAGFAHTHPGVCAPRPSAVDTSTFEAVEAALGRRLQWWIVTRDRAAVFAWREGEYVGAPLADEPPWVAALRQRSEEGVER